MAAPTIVRTALAVLNAVTTGTPADPHDVLRLRQFAGPEAADWSDEVVASHVLAVELQRAARGSAACAGE